MKSDSAGYPLVGRHPLWSSAVKFQKALAFFHKVTSDFPQKGQGRMALFHVARFSLGIVG